MSWVKKIYFCLESSCVPWSVLHAVFVGQKGYLWKVSRCDPGKGALRNLQPSVRNMQISLRCGIIASNEGYLEMSTVHLHLYQNHDVSRVYSNHHFCTFQGPIFWKPWNLFGQEKPFLVNCYLNVHVKKCRCLKFLVKENLRSYQEYMNKTDL